MRILFARVLFISKCSGEPVNWKFVFNYSSWERANTVLDPGFFPSPILVDNQPTQFSPSQLSIRLFVLFKPIPNSPLPVNFALNALTRKHVHAAALPLWILPAAKHCQSQLLTVQPPLPMSTPAQDANCQLTTTTQPSVARRARTGGISNVRTSARPCTTTSAAIPRKWCALAQPANLAAASSAGSAAHATPAYRAPSAS